MPVSARERKTDSLREGERVLEGLVYTAVFVSCMSMFIVTLRWLRSVYVCLLDKEISYLLLFVIDLLFLKVPYWLPFTQYLPKL